MIRVPVVLVMSIRVSKKRRRSTERPIETEVIMHILYHLWFLSVRGERCATIYR